MKHKKIRREALMGIEILLVLAFIAVAFMALLWKWATTPYVPIYGG